MPHNALFTTYALRAKLFANEYPHYERPTTKQFHDELNRFTTEIIRLHTDLHSLRGLFDELHEQLQHSFDEIPAQKELLSKYDADAISDICDRLARSMRKWAFGKTSLLGGLTYKGVTHIFGKSYPWYEEHARFMKFFDGERLLIKNRKSPRDLMMQSETFNELTLATSKKFDLLFMHLHKLQQHFAAVQSMNPVHPDLLQAKELQRCINATLTILTPSEPQITLAESNLVRV